MKNSAIIIILAVSFLFSCESKHASLQFKSPQEVVVINIEGVKPSFLDPFETNINIQGLSHDDTVYTEIYVDNLTAEVIQVDWSSETEGVMSITERDGVVRTFSLSVSESHIQLYE